MFLCLTFLSEESILHTSVVGKMATKMLGAGRILMINILKALGSRIASCKMSDD